MPLGSCSIGQSGDAKQNTSVFAIGFAPSPQPIMSRMQPPTPVAAPPYGSMAEGWLCVSTLKAIPYSSSNSMMPALSLKTEMHHGLFSLRVAAAMVSSRRFP